MDINKLMTNNLLRAAKRYQDTKTAKLQIDIKENQIILSALFFSFFFFFFPLYSLSFLYVNSICTVESFLYIAHFFFSPLYSLSFLYVNSICTVESFLYIAHFLLFSFFFSFFFSFKAESFCQKTCYTRNDNNNTNFTYIHNIHDKKLTETSTVMAEAQRMPQHIE